MRSQEALINLPQTGFLWQTHASVLHIRSTAFTEGFVVLFWRRFAPCYCGCTFDTKVAAHVNFQAIVGAGIVAIVTLLIRQSREQRARRFVRLTYDDSLYGL